jgi:hypothetical protein
MKKFGPCHCRVCKGLIDRNVLKEGEDWVMPSKNWYYHTKCYEDWGKKKNDVHANFNEDLWKDATWNYLVKELKIPIDFTKMNSQWTNFIKKGKTAKGIYFSLRYFYDIQKGNPSKAEGGIGIVNYVYDEGCRYWVDQETKNTGICARIEEQIKQAAAREKVKIRQRRKAEKKGRYDISSIAEMEDIYD